MLPEKWFIIRNAENADVLNKWENETYHNGKRAAHLKHFAYMFSDKKYTDRLSTTNGYEEITFEDFKKYFLNKDQQMERKIIGYKAPMDLFNGFISKDTIYKAVSGIDITTYCAVDERGNVKDSGRTNLPKEIVETWEPIYEEPYKVGDYVFVDCELDEMKFRDDHNSLEAKILDKKVVQVKSIEGNFIEVEGSKEGGIWFTEIRKATEEEIKEAKKFKAGDYVIWTDDYDPKYKSWFVKGDIVRLEKDQGNTETVLMYKKGQGEGGFYTTSNKFRKATPEEVENYERIEIEGYPLKVHRNSEVVNFGCQEFTKEQLQTYRDFLSRGAFVAKMSVGNTEITLGLIDKILEKLK